jgi:hypothetical protein
MPLYIFLDDEIILLNITFANLKDIIIHVFLNFCLLKNITFLLEFICLLQDNKIRNIIK